MGPTEKDNAFSDSGVGVMEPFDLTDRLLLLLFLRLRRRAGGLLAVRCDVVDEGRALRERPGGCPSPRT